MGKKKKKSVANWQKLWPQNSKMTPKNLCGLMFYILTKKWLKSGRTLLQYCTYFTQKPKLLAETGSADSTIFYPCAL
jgi:hypothetical protein